MNSVEFFLKEYNYHILTSVTNKKAFEFVCIDGEYKKLVLPDKPFVLRRANGMKNIGKNRKLEFLYPLSPNSACELMDLEDYCYHRDNYFHVQYLKISESDRLKLSNWIRNERNIRYDVYNYADLSLYSARRTYQKKCPYRPVNPTPLS